MKLDLSKIVDGLRFLLEADRNLAVFGANGHKYELRPRLDEGKVVEFERRYAIRLPDEYRRFLIELGNGGAGPYYGIHGLDELYETQADYWNDLSKPFPYRHQWAGPPELLKAMNDEDPNEVDDEDRSGKLIYEYWQVASRDGSINICEYGCNLRFLLILNGPEFGRIWFDATSDLGGYSPVGLNPTPAIERYSKWCITDKDTSEDNRVGFAEWYHCWLDWACRLVREGAA